MKRVEKRNVESTTGIVCFAEKLKIIGCTAFESLDISAVLFFRLRFKIFYGADAKNKHHPQFYQTHLLPSA
jgi:hypothetical protein